MAPIKFEEQLKDKLEKRSLQPSADSWTKLSSRLEAEEKKSKKPWLGWLSIAAGIIILVSIAIRTFGSQTTVESETPVIVEQQESDVIINDEPLVLDKDELLKLAVEDDVEVDDQKMKSSSKPSMPEVLLSKKTVPNNTKLAVAPKTIKQPEKSKKTESLLKSPDVMDTKINKEAVAEALSELQNQKSITTDREVDSLLKLASKELLKDKLIKDTSKTVDAQSLLDDVQDEMGQSFRSKVYEVLKDGYKKVKTAVADRNN